LHDIDAFETAVAAYEEAKSACEEAQVNYLPWVIYPFDFVSQRDIELCTDEMHALLESSDNH
jgi:hypothetical protein